MSTLFFTTTAPITLLRSNKRGLYRWVSRIANRGWPQKKPQHKAMPFRKLLV